MEIPWLAQVNWGNNSSYKYLYSGRISYLTIGIILKIIKTTIASKIIDEVVVQIKGEENIEEDNRSNWTIIITIILNCYLKFILKSNIYYIIYIFYMFV